jgi:hypothetical protein
MLIWALLFYANLGAMAAICGDICSSNDHGDGRRDVGRYAAALDGQRNSFNDSWKSDDQGDYGRRLPVDPQALLRCSTPRGSSSMTFWFTDELQVLIESLWFNINF